MKTYNLKKSPFTYTLVIVILLFVTSLTTRAALSFSFQNSTNPTIPQSINYSCLFEVLILAPIVETFFLQHAPFYIGTKFQWSLKTITLISILLFATVHLFNGIPAFISSGIVGGIYLALSYRYWLRVSSKIAFQVTFYIHFMHNLLTIMLFSAMG